MRRFDAPYRRLRVPALTAEDDGKAAALGPPRELVPLLDRYAATVPGLLSRAECAYLVKESERMGYDSLDQEYRAAYRSNERCVVDSPELVLTILPSCSASSGWTVPEWLRSLNPMKT